MSKLSIPILLIGLLCFSCTPKQTEQTEPQTEIDTPPKVDTPTKITNIEVENLAALDPFIQAAISAINEGDIQTQDDLRYEVQPEQVPVLVSYWDKSQSWTLKDGFVTILMDQSGEILAPMMKDALHSPTVEIRAYAVSILSGDDKLFDTLLGDGGWVDEEKVDAAINDYLSGQE